MAGSYNHVVTKKGKLRNPQQVAEMLETKGDVYEAVEEMYGMIHFLADRLGLEGGGGRNFWIERARHHYVEGIELSPGRQKEDKELK